MCLPAKRSPSKTGRPAPHWPSGPRQRRGTGKAHTLTVFYQLPLTHYKCNMDICDFVVNVISGVKKFFCIHKTDSPPFCVIWVKTKEIRLCVDQ